MHEMEVNFNKLFPKELIKSGYKNNKEYIDDNLKRVRMIIDAYKTCMEDNNFKKNKGVCEKQILMSDLYISYRLENTNKMISIPAHHLKDCFRFDDLEWICFLVHIIFKVDFVYKKRFSEMFGFDHKSPLNYDSVLKLFYFVENLEDIDDVYNKLTCLRFKMNDLCIDQKNMSIDDNIFNFFISGEKKVELSGTEIYLPEEDGTGVLPIRERTAKKIVNIIKSEEKDKQFCFCLHGEKGIGKKTLVKRASELLVKGSVIIDLNFYVFLHKENFYNLIYQPLREALIINGTICLEHFEVFDEMNPQKYEYLEFFLKNVTKFSKEVFVLSSKGFFKLPDRKDISVINISLEKLTHKENFAMWNKRLKDMSEVIKAPTREVANKFHFTPMQINRTLALATSLWQWKEKKQLKIKDLCKCAYAQSISKISKKATIITPRHTWNELILDEREKKMLKSACNRVKYSHIVYDDWGMDKRIIYGRGLSMLFSGAPGTGKTMAAQVVANELGLEIYKADLSQIVSKYIGETEKNLNELFDEAKKSNVILFFDETDALLGKRTEVKDSHDKNANIETSFLLQKMEEYDGITIMTTNYLENIDKAFFRRISYVIHFAFPDEDARKKIWKGMFPDKVPISDDVDFDYLSKNFEISGGNIKNIALNAAFMAASESKSIMMEHILKSLQYELKKQGKNVIKDEFGEYGYLMTE